MKNCTWKRFAALILCLLLALPAAALAAGGETLRKGDYVTFGRYPQNSTGLDQTPIEWLVLDVQGSKVLLISRYGLDSQPYNTQKKDVTWETCTLRAWLNNEFLNKAFNKEEQQVILTTKVDNSKKQNISTWTRARGGSDTQDKIFLLSYAEANKYFNLTWENERNMQSRITSTDYTFFNRRASVFKGKKTSDGDPAAWWWLRSHGNEQNSAAFVMSDGSLYYDDVNATGASIRPALWVDLSASLF